MTGLEKIIKIIEADAREDVDKILSEANEEAKQILTLAEEESKQIVAKSAEKHTSEINAIINRAESSARLIKRQMILDAKQQIISNIIEKAKHSFASLSNKEYFDIILQIVKKHAHSQPGIMIFSQADLDRLPEDFQESLDMALKDINNASLTVSRENTAKIDGGFILLYGDIEENCSFDALFNDAKDELQDKTNAFLFE